MTENPANIDDIAVRVKYHFNIVIFKTILIGSSLLISETEQQIRIIVDKHMKTKL